VDKADCFGTISFFGHGQGVYNCVFEMTGFSPLDRDWILIGLAECCAERGYEATSVAEICAEAGVARESFERLFADKEECLAAAAESVIAEARSRIETAHSPGMSWAASLRTGAGAVLELLAERPALAYATLVEAPVAGGHAQELHAAARAEALAYLEGGREHAVEQGIPASAGHGALAGVEALLVFQLLGGHGKDLGAQADAVTYLLAVPYLGRRAAAQAAESGRRDTAPRRLRAVA